MGFFPRPSLAAQLTFLPDTPIARREIRGAGVDDREQVPARGVGGEILPGADLIAAAINQAVYGGDWPLGPTFVERQRQLERTR